MTCREVAEFLIDYLEGDLAGDSRREFEHHLSRCEACRRYLFGYRMAVELGRSAFRDEDEAALAAGVPEDLIRAILAAAPGRDHP